MIKEIPIIPTGTALPCLVSLRRSNFFSD